MPKLCGETKCHGLDLLWFAWRAWSFFEGGGPQTKSGMEIAAVYLQSIEMDPPGVMRPAAESDVHLESDIKAAKDNKNGFAQGD